MCHMQCNDQILYFASSICIKVPWTHSDCWHCEKTNLSSKQLGLVAFQTLFLWVVWCLRWKCWTQKLLLDAFVIHYNTPKIMILNLSLLLQSQYLITTNSQVIFVARARIGADAHCTVSQHKEILQTFKNVPMQSMRMYGQDCTSYEMKWIDDD